MSRTQESRGTGRGPDAEDAPAFTLDREIAQKYEPATLSRLIMKDAGRGEALDLGTRNKMERRLGGDFSNVRVMRGPLAEEITTRYRADAVTVGGTELILVREGWQSNFQTAEGAALLAHELTHVKQQQRGLHFAHSGDDMEGGDHEDEAYGVQAAVKAEEQGGRMADEANKLRKKAGDDVWQRVKYAVEQKRQGNKATNEIRDGSANLQADIMLA